MKALSQTLEDLFETISDKEKVPAVLDNWESIRESYKFIKRPDGKRLSSQDKQILSVLLELVKNNKQVVDYAWLEEKLLRSQRTIKRILDNLGNCFDCKFYNCLTINNKKYFNKILITPTKQLQNILFNSYSEMEKTKYKKPYVKHFPNPYKINDTGGQNPQEGSTLLSTPIYSNKRKQEEEITTTELVTTTARAREESEQNIDVINQKTLVVANLTEPPKVFCTETKETELPTESKPKIINFMSKIEENPEGFATRSGSLQPQVGNPTTFATATIATMYKTDDQLLSKLYVEVCKSFGSLSGANLVKQLRFIVLGEKKIGIRMNNVDLAEGEKNQLRVCIKNIYGDDTKIVALGSKSLDLPHDKTTPSNEGTGQIVPLLSDNTEQKETNSPMSIDIWSLMRRKLIDRIHGGKYVDMHLLSKLEATIDKESKKITLKAPSSFIRDLIFQNCLFDIEVIAAENNFSVGLCEFYGNNSPWYSDPEKIKKELFEYDNKNMK